MFDFSRKLMDLIEAAVPGIVWNTIPAQWKSEARELVSEWGPFKTLSTNHDLIRAVRIAWVNATLRIFDAVMAAKLPEHERERQVLEAFVAKARPKLRDIRFRAFNRDNAPGDTPIDVHALGVLAGTPEFIHPSGSPEIDADVNRHFAETLSKITDTRIKDIPSLVLHAAQYGIGDVKEHRPRRFGELVFSDFAELLKDPSRYPEAMPAFQIYMAGATRELGEAIRADIGQLATAQGETLERLDALTILGAENQRVWLDFLDSTEAALADLSGQLEGQSGQLDELLRKSDNQTVLLKTILERVSGEKLLDEKDLRLLWNVFKRDYLTRGAALWQESFPNGRLSDFGAGIEEQLRSTELFSLPAPPLIDSQEFRLIIPDDQCRQLPQVKDYSADGAIHVGFEDIAEGLCGVAEQAARLAPPMPQVGVAGLRLALVSSSGIGKSTTMRRLQREINSRLQGFAVLIDFADIQDADGTTDANLERVLPRILASLGIAVPSRRLDETPALAMQVMGYGLKHEMEQGRLIVLIDGLDHVGSTPSAVLHFQNSAIWQNAHVVLSGRPEAFQDWRQSNVQEYRGKLPDLTRWRIIAPTPLTDDQAKAYLGGFLDPEADGGRIWRYDLVSRSLGDLLNLPRVLAHMRRLSRSELAEAKTAADIYDRAIRNLLREALSNGSEAREASLDRLLGLLGALAFQTMFQGPSGVRSARKQHYLPSGRKSTRLREDSGTSYPLAPAMEELRTRTQPIYAKLASGALEKDLKTLARLSTLVGNGLLEIKDNMPDTLSTVAWVNRTVSAFLAAYWLANWAARAPEVEPEVGNDSSWFREAVYYPHIRDREHVYELNLFLSEMPANRINARCWVAAASAWYDPRLVREDGRLGLWSTEMLARSWRVMHDIAERDVDDWWDISYEELAAVSPARRAEKSLHRRPNIATTDPEIKAARAAIAMFHDDFGDQLARHGPAMLGIIAPGGWASIPAGEYRMGSPRSRQGFPRKTLAYWRQTLREVAAATDLTDIINAISPAWWWSGLQGRRQRAEEISWLRTVFERFRAAIAVPDKRGIAERKALGTLRDYFRRRDETPLEEIQKVAAFELAVRPVTNAAFSLFNPGHIAAMRDEVDENLRNVFGDAETEERRVARGWDGPERPAIYVTWFDAWAFCQWVRWTEDGRRHGCRLPHEAEWEFACKRRIDPATGESVPSAFTDRYWWGDSFYAQEAEPVKEPISTAHAHAMGAPGATRDPAVLAAQPNGFGLEDMIGNVWEWNANVYDMRSETELKQAERTYGYSRHRPARTPPHLGASRAMRGGIWYYMDHISTAANRFRGEPDDSDYKIGFRLLRERL